ncbi:MAG: copper amine oxidase N-terminal domain-containing protein [Ruminococcaceae bacterium]|nr:copper amine oxidase N-terminal domain-containing protein [Oscillospiraceae bacterium]
MQAEAIALDVPAQLTGGRTLVPARAVSEAFGAFVDWDEATRTVIIITE